ncbi:hypothetical protein GP486_000595 [Trichoglossum hirsutum]|uniref:PNPLA domain-containing protein n=1 Tax=Trichoglossum hirsutum TaxID=265104 RepID=A0A9P8LIQ5_9PEZI|nr:hypothetical protein GP486_000595 [Trichoglossum hirsutum]
MESIQPKDPPRPCDYFDMIGGTSTGGLIALMLGRLRMGVDECISAYIDLSPKIFTKLHHRLKLKGHVQGRFDHKAIEDGVKTLLVERGLDKDALLLEKFDSPCKTWVTPIPPGTVVLSSYFSKRRGWDMAQQAKIWQAARATSAASSFFDPVEIEHEEFVDGATPANNPINEMWTEAYDAFHDPDDLSWNLEDNILCLISIGTGIPSLKPFGTDPLHVGRSLVAIATDTERRAQDFHKHHTKMHKEHRYFRFNVLRGLEDVGLEDASKRKEIFSATRLYLQTEDVFTQMEACAKVMNDREWPEVVFALANCYADRAKIGLRNHQSMVKGYSKISPSSEVLAWFTNTNNYRKWVESDGGWLYYPFTPRTNQGLGKIYLTKNLDGEGESTATGNEDGVNEILKSLICQGLVAFCESGEKLWHMLCKRSPEERRNFKKDFSEFEVIPSKRLYALLNFIMEHLGNDTEPCKKFFVINRIDCLSQSDVLNALIRLRVDLERLSVCTLVTGMTRGLEGKLDWGADRLKRVDEDTEFQECLESLHFNDVYTRRDQVAYAEVGSNQWIWSHLAYQEWIQKPSGILWIQGKPGSGKSVLAKSIVNQISSSSTILVASWFYSRRSGSVGTSHSSMMRSIIYQLLKQNRELFRLYQGFYRHQQGDEFAAFGNLLRLSSMEEGIPNILCVLDAMDESIHRDIPCGHDILGLFSELVEEPKSRLKIMVLSRRYRAIERSFGSYDILLENENSGDIKTVVDMGLRFLRTTIQSLDSGDEELSPFAQRRRASRMGLRVTSFLNRKPKNDEIVEQIELETMRAYLLKNAQGVILWVTLSISETIRYAEKGLYTWPALRTLLTCLPLELHEMYQGISTDLHRSHSEINRATTRKILGWVMAASAKRPFLLRELLDALAIPEQLDQGINSNSSEDPIYINRPRVKSWNGFRRSLQELCGPFVEVISPGTKASEKFTSQDVGPDSVVQLLHQTVKEFLDRSTAESFTLKIEEAHLMMKQAARRYLQLALPLEITKYAPVVQDIGDDWERTVEDVVTYLEDKMLLKFALATCLPDDSELLEIAQSHNDSVWMLSSFFNILRYYDLDVPETAMGCVVGRCFWIACYQGLSIAVDNMLCVTSLSPGWWYYHRDTVLNAVLLAARDHSLDRIILLLTSSRDRFSSLAIKRSEADNPRTLLRRSHRPTATYGWYRQQPKHHSKQHSRALPLHLRKASPEEAEAAIQRVLDYLDN